MVKVERYYWRRYTFPDGSIEVSDRQLKYGTVLPKGGITVVQLKAGGVVLADGHAYCKVSDGFVKKVGYSLAFVQAYEKLLEFKPSSDPDLRLVFDLASSALAQLQEEYATCRAFAIESAAKSCEKDAAKLERATVRAARLQAKATQTSTSVVYTRTNTCSCTACHCRQAEYNVSPKFVNGQPPDGINTFDTSSDARWNHDE